MDAWTITLTVIAGAVILYWFSTRNHNYFKKRGISCISPWPIFGNMGPILFRTKSFADVMNDTYKIHPDAKYVGFYEFSTPVIMLKDPELVKQVAIKYFDSFPNHRPFVETTNEPLLRKNLISLADTEWKDMRALLSPAFTSSKMKIMFEVVSQCAVNFANYLAAQNPQPENLDMKDTFGRYTLDVIASTAFGLSTDSLKNRNNDFYNLGKKVTDFSGIKMFKFFLLRNFPGLAQSLDIRILDHKVSSYFLDIIKTTIETRDREGILRPDMIHLMMQAREREAKSNLSMEDMAAQAFIFLLGGFDSPATTMCFATHFLALNLHVQRKLQAEIDEILEKNPEGATYEEIHEMKYLDAVVNETLRIFSPGIVLDRVCSKAFTLPPALPGLEPLEVKPSQEIWIPIYSFNRDEKFFANPDQFDPERFNDVNKREINPLAYLPFGIGPRICIANRFALMVVKLALFHVLAKCDVLPCSKTRPEIKLSTADFTLVPVDGFWLKIQSRKK